MPNAARLGDPSTPHVPPPPGSMPSVSASKDVLINGKGSHRMGDKWDSHHPPTKFNYLAKGSATVLVNGKPKGRVDDPIDCGVMVKVGSPDVITGG